MIRTDQTIHDLVRALEDLGLPALLLALSDACGLRAGMCSDTRPSVRDYWGRYERRLLALARAADRD